MRDICTVYRKELRSYIVSPIPYVFLTIFTVFAAYYFFWIGDGEFFVRRVATLQHGLFGIVDWMLVFLVPAISMRLWSEEVRTGTIEQLMTLPVPTHALVIGKFLTAWTLLLVALLLTLPIAITVSMYGALDWGPVIGGYAGAWLFGGALLTLGLWISSLTNHQVVAFLITLVIGAALILLKFASDSAGTVTSLINYLSPSSHYQSMGRGVIELRDIVFFLSFMFFFGYLNVQAVENRRVR